MKEYFFVICMILLVISCSKDTKTSYRLVGKDGKVIYIDTREGQNGSRTRKSFQDTEHIENKAKTKAVNDNESIKQVENKKIPLISSAYTLDSVIDKDVKYDVGVNDSFENIRKNKKHKTISDFESIPSSYFNDAEINRNRKKKSKSVLTTTEKKSDLDIVNVDFNSNSNYYVQLGLFSNKEKAIKLKNRFNYVYDLNLVETKNKNGEVLYKILTKAISSKSEANRILEEIKKAGHNDVFVFKK